VNHINSHTLLKQYFGHSAFRPGQKTLIDALLSGKDVLGVMPTGAGKSICYQIPALQLPGVTLVISPLISLMKDQVAALSRYGIPCAFINSSLTQEEYYNVYRGAQVGAYKLIYVAPERLLTEDFLRFSGSITVSLVAVDEAHCVSQWGQDFRPSYLQIPEFLSLLSARPVVGAFTATATAEVKEDIKKLLGLQTPVCLTTGFDRPNLRFEVFHPKTKKVWLLSFLDACKEQSGIIYCATRKKVEDVCSTLVSQGFEATRYHAGLSDEERKRNQDEFLYDRVKIMVATNAFGMGIDKSNVSYVVHFNMPKNIESYYQEAGRAGRDGSIARCILLYSSNDVRTAKYLITNAAENERLTPEERMRIQKQDLERLEHMTAYCTTDQCLRKTLLSYFGETMPHDCGNCSNCGGEIIEQDITVEAQKILSAVVRAERKYSSGIGLTLIVRMLHGSREQRILQLGLDKLSTYGIMRDTPRSMIRTYINALITKGYLILTDGEYPVLRITEKARNVLFHGETVSYMQKVEEELPRDEKKKAGKPAQANKSEDLITVLKRVRAELAKSENVPVYIIFSNATLEDMANQMPLTRETLLQVSGVGEIKANRYGRIFLKAIAEWLIQKNNETS